MLILRFNQAVPLTMPILLPAILTFLGVKAINEEVQVFEQRAASDLAEVLEGPFKEVKVKTKFNGPFGPAFADLYSATISAKNFRTPGLPLFCEPEKAQTGIIRMFNIELDDFYLGKLEVFKLRASIPDCRFDAGLALKSKKIRLTRSGTGIGKVWVHQDALARFIPNKVREIKTAEVQIKQGRVIVQGYCEFIFAKSDYWVSAELKIVNGRKLELTNATVILDWQKADDFAKKVLLDALNPIVDLDKDLKLYGAIEMSKVGLENGYLTAEGATKIPSKPIKTEPKE